jgi:hypothetical protein
MVLISGDENIVRFDRARIRGYYIFGSVMLFLALVAVALAVDQAVDDSRIAHTDRTNITVLLLVLVQYSAICIVPLMYLGLKAYQAGRAFSQGFVAIGPEEVRLRLVIKRWLDCVVVPEQRFKWEVIEDLTCKGKVCRFRAGSRVYTLSEECSPSPPTVAQLMATTMRVQLPSHELPLPPGKKATTRLTQAAISGGISLVLIGVFVSGGFWVYGRVGGPYYALEFFSLVVLGTLALIFFGTAIVLLVLEVNHRF